MKTNKQPPKPQAISEPPKPMKTSQKKPSKAKEADLEEELGVSTPNLDQLANLSKLVDQALKLMKEIETAEDFVKTTKNELHILNTRTLPDAFASAGTIAFTAADGTKVKINDFVNGSLPKLPDKREKALQYLKSIGGEDLIKNTIEIAFERGEHNIAGMVREFLDKAEIEYEDTIGVHPQTLAAHARERMKKGEETQLELLGLYAGRTAKIDPPKEKP